MNKEIKTDSPAFKFALALSKSLGPFSSNPKIDEAYRSLRLLGLSREETINAIQEKLNNL